MLVVRCSRVVLTIAASAIAALPTIALAHETPMTPPPSGWDMERSGIPHGMVMSTTYPAGSYGMKNMRVYLPPGYSTARKYPVLYLHHGLGGTEAGWTDNNLKAHIVLDNLIADGMAVPMIIVMPNNSMTSPDDVAGYGQYETILVPNLIPHIEANFSAATDQPNRAIAGLSLGGGISFNSGFRNINLFAHIGPFSAAPNTNPPAQTIPNPAAVRQMVKTIMVTCGSVDGLISNSRNYDTFFEQNMITHEFLVDAGQGHTVTVWRRSLYYFLQRIFKDGGTGTGGNGGMNGGAGGSGVAGQGGRGSGMAGRSGNGGATGGNSGGRSGSGGTVAGTGGSIGSGTGGMMVAGTGGAAVGTGGSIVTGSGGASAGTGGAAVSGGTGGSGAPTGTGGAGPSVGDPDPASGCACALSPAGTRGAASSETMAVSFSLALSVAVVVLRRTRTGRRRKLRG